MSDVQIVFDRTLRRRQRARARLDDAGFLLDETADGIAGRLAPVLRRFPLAVDLGSHDGRLSRVLAATDGVDTVVRTEEMPALLAGHGSTAAVCDAEALPFADAAIDLLVSALTLQWTNDLPGALAQIRRALRPDGLFVAALAGGATLHELRICLMDAEIEATGGASLRVAPFVELRDLAGLLQRAGFALPVVDADTLTVRYDSMLALLADLRAMGWGNALTARARRPLTRRMLTRAAELYQERHADADGRVRATFEILYASGWAPHESQQKPLRPGSARMRLADALGVREMPAGDKAPLPRRD